MRVCEAIHITDPNEIVVCFATLILRRRYLVPCLQLLWHIDGNDKLIRWRIVVHRGLMVSRVFLFFSTVPMITLQLELLVISI